MATIKHRIFIKSTRKKVFKAITTREGLMSWWTSDVQVSEDGQSLTFGFMDHTVVFHMETKDVVPNAYLVWHCAGTLEEWTHTRLIFEISEAKDGRIQLDFTHTGWGSDKKDFRQCCTDWGHLMYYLKDYAEGRNDTPFMS
ncbi:MAG TPA: SRPBCC domain-containing protein [Eudoraea sp.]|nr:SRPBCC domain-containing protein [Eudoraea sp.]